LLWIEAEDGMIWARMTTGLLAAALSGILTTVALAQRSSAPAIFVAAADYSNPTNWLCLPGRADACKVDQSATEVSASGHLRLEEFDPPRREPVIDCFYVYPTVSNDPGEMSDLIPGPEERNVVSRQFARFAASCRQFAPMYRQFTLGALRAGMTAQAAGDGPPPLFKESAPGGGYADVLNAWNYYLTHDNKGRGFVLIGHSQGAGHLIRLMQQEIDGKPIQRQLVSAILLGGAVQVPVGKDVGATFKAIPLCRADRQTGCVITYSSFRDNVPPPANSLFSRNGDGTVAACTNPADLKSGKGEPTSYFAAARANDPETGAPQGWVTPFQPIGTPFVTTPGLVTTTCVNNGGFSYLSVHVNAKPRDPRSDTISGDVMAGRNINAMWGLHLIDMNLSMGDLVELVGKEGRAWKPAK
jgi:hypothetical protein